MSHKLVVTCHNITIISLLRCELKQIYDNNLCIKAEVIVAKSS